MLVLTLLLAQAVCYSPSDCVPPFVCSSLKDGIIPGTCVSPTQTSAASSSSSKAETSSSPSTTPPAPPAPAAPSTLPAPSTPPPSTSSSSSSPTVHRTEELVGAPFKPEVESSGTLPIIGPAWNAWNSVIQQTIVQPFHAVLCLFFRCTDDQ